MSEAQLGTANFVFKVSADEGQTWQTGVVEVANSQRRIRVRPVASWSTDAGRWFAGARYDIVWRNMSNGLDDIYVLGARATGFRLATQTMVSSRFGSSIKVDDSRDTLPPGQGTFGVNSSQGAPAFGFGDESNPAVLAEFWFDLDGTPGDREVTALFLPPPNGNTSDRFMSIYTTYDGSQNKPLSTFSPAIVRVLPCPADFDRNGTADFFDYLDFAQAFADEDPRADFTGDAQIDFFDYLDFVQAFDEGC
jgi:hypothetical protein